MSSTRGIGGKDGLQDANIRDGGRSQLAADDAELGAMHDEADGFLRANDIIGHLSDEAGRVDHDAVLQALQDAVELGARLARQANGRPIRVVYGADAYGDCRFYFIGTSNEVCLRLRRDAA